MTTVYWASWREAMWGVDWPTERRWVGAAGGILAFHYVLRKMYQPGVTEMRMWATDSLDPEDGPVELWP